jgi:hypothetical protein
MGERGRARERKREREPVVELMIDLSAQKDI